MQDLIFTQDVDILFLAETFLTDTVADNVLSISNYTLHRRDRPTHGGGLAAYVKSSYQTRVISNYRASQVELLAVEVKGRHTQLLLGGVYRPPGTPVIGWQDLSDAVDLAISASPTSHLCPLHISRSDAPIVPRCCRLGQCEWSPDTESAVGASSGGHREVIGQY